MRRRVGVITISDMIKRSLALFVAAYLSLLPASAAVTSGPSAKNTGGVRAANAPSAPLLAIPTSGLTIAATPALAVIERLESATADSLAAAAADPAPAAAFAAAMAARPALLADAAVRAEAVAALGEPAVLRLELAVSRLTARAASDAALSAALTKLRRETPLVDPAKAKDALARVAAELDAPKTDAAIVVSASDKTAPALKPAPRRPGALRRYALAALAALTFSQAVPAASVTSEPKASAVLAQAGQRQADYVTARDVEEALNQASADKHLYVVGNPRIDRETLRRLAAYLADKNWSVVIVADADGNRFTNGEGRTFRGLEAVDYGTGQGLFDKLGNAAKHPVSGQRAHSILTIVLEQRELFLRGSDAMRANGLDVKSGRPFKNDLDQWAKPPLRKGLDVYGAVTGTIDNLDLLTNQAIAQTLQNAAGAVAEAKSLLETYAKTRAQFTGRHPAAAVGQADLAAARRAVAEAEALLAAKKTDRALERAAGTVRDVRAALEQMDGFERAAASAAERLTSAQTELSALERAAAEYRSSHKSASGDLARPGVSAWRESLAAAHKLQAKDPVAAEAAAARVLAEVRARAEALAAHPAGERLIAETRALERGLAGRLRAGEAQPQLTAAAQALREAASAHDNGSSAWAALLAQAKEALAEAERVIDAADAAAKTKLIVFWLFNILGGLLTLGAFTWLNRRAAAVGRKAEASLAEWDAILDRKLEAIYGGAKPGDALNSLEAKIETYVGPATGAQSRGWLGDTADLTSQIRKDSGYAKLLLSKARAVHDEALALVRPKAWLAPGWWRNLVSPAGYARAERLLSTEPLEFKPEDGLLDASGRKSDWRGDLYGDADSYKPFRLSFKDLMAKFNASAKAAVDALTKLEHAVTQSGAVFDALDAKIAAAAQSREALASAADGLFAAAALFEKALPDAGRQVAASRQTALKDPVQAVYGGGAEAERVVSDASALISVLTTARSGALASTDAAARAIAAASVENAWIADAKKKLSAKADKIAADAAAKPVAQRVATLAGELTALAAQTDDIARGAQALTALRLTLEGTETAVAAARARLAAALGLPVEKMLAEKDADPSEFIAAARGFAETTDALLGEGRLAEAKEAFTQAEQAARGAAAIVAAGLKSLETHAAVEQERRAETERLEGLVPERMRVLASIESDFAASVLALNAGDASHPNSNGTVKDNVEEASAALEAAAGKREKALRAYAEGKVIAAADLLSQAAAHQAVAQHRLDEISEKRARLDAAVAANKAARETLEAKVLEYQRTVADDRRATKPTLKALGAAKKDLAAAAESIDAAKGDPFKAAAALAAAGAALEQVWVSARNDFDAYAEVERSLQAAYKQLQTAGQLAQQAQNDATADSPAITSAYRELAALEKAYGAAVEAAKAEHGDWSALDREADRLTSEAAHVAASLKDELSAAVAATNAVSSAASKVREATSWSGSHGVYIPGSPGSGQLDSARDALGRGDYAGAVRAAENARRAAASAIAEAEAEVERHREEERRRRRQEEEERRRRQQEEDDRRRSSSGSSGGSDWGSSSSGNSGSSWGGSSSGNSSSSW